MSFFVRFRSGLASIFGFKNRLKSIENRSRNGYKIAIDFGIDPVHFALVVVMNFAIGMVTPPYGITLFVASAIAERNVLQVARKMFWPWLIMTTTLVVVTYIPSFGLYLPRLSGLLD